MSVSQVVLCSLSQVLLFPPSACVVCVGTTHPLAPRITTCNHFPVHLCIKAPPFFIPFAKLSEHLPNSRPLHHFSCSGTCSDLILVTVTVSNSVIVTDLLLTFFFFCLLVHQYFLNLCQSLVALYIKTFTCSTCPLCVFAFESSSLVCDGSVYFSSISVHLKHILWENPCDVLPPVSWY